MKVLWRAFTALCVLHLFAIVGVVAWLYATDRLNLDRLESVKDTFAPTVAQAEVDLEATAERQAMADQQARRLESIRSQGAGDASSENILQSGEEADEQAHLALDFKRLEIQSLDQRLKLDKARLDARRKALDARQTALDLDMQKLKATADDKGFKTAVTLLEQLPPKTVKNQFMTMLGNPQSLDQVVSYLNAMEPRKASAVLREFKTPEEIILAVKLMDRLRAPKEKPMG